MKNYIVTLVIVLASGYAVAGAPSGYELHKAMKRQECRARKRNKQFSMTKGYYAKFWDKPCVYCGSDLKGVHFDRVNSDRGYVEGNVVQACPRCNSMKSTDSVKDWLNKMRTILKKCEKGYHNDKKR